jgi:hypothetical protein
MANDDLWNGWCGYSAHPDSPAGAGGPGKFRQCSPHGAEAGRESMLAHPASPISRHAALDLGPHRRLFAQTAGRPAAQPRQDLPAVAPAVVTRVIVVTSGDPRQLAVQGSTARVSQQHIWDRLARQLANEPAPNNGITRILHPPTITALENQLRQISGQGGHVSRMDWVGHGSDARTHTEGFHLYGIHSGPDQWVSPDDMVRLIADTGIATGVSSFENRFWACYSDVWVDRVSEGLRRRGVPNPHATGQVGDFTPRYGPLAGHPADPERNWVVDPSGTTQSSGQRQPTVSPGELRGL